MSDEAKDSQVTDEVKKGDESPPKVEYLGREVTAEELLEEAKRKDAYITQRDQELAELRRQEEPETPEPNEQLKEAQRVLNELGYVDKKAAEQLVQETISKHEAQRTIDQSMRELSKKYDGSGNTADYPVFKDMEVAQYAHENGFSNLEAAYRDMHRDKILAVEIDKANQKASKTSSATPDRSDAARTEPVDKGTIEKILTPEVVSDPTKLARALEELGMGSPPTPK